MPATTTNNLKTNLNSVSNGCTTSLAALKQHITTCLQRWRQKRLSTKCNRIYCEEEKRQKETVHSNEECFRYCRFYNSDKWFGRTNCKGHSFVQKFNSLQSKITGKNSNSTINSDKKGPRNYGRRVEIVAKLLSASLIAKAITEKKSCDQQTDERTYSCFEKHLRIFNSTTSTSQTGNCYTHDTMTITELSFLEIRNEYPDLDSEIRSILTARAQDGATISEIRDDYRKLTGIPFPIYEDVTEFLLTIPHVTAYCSEKGTRIFNIRPMEKTKHIHEMVMQQKNPAEHMQRPTEQNRYYYRERQHNNNYHRYAEYDNASRDIQSSTPNIFVQPNINYCVQEELIPTTDKARDASEAYIENNCFYQDNCDYLLKRYQQYPPLPPRNHILTNTHVEEQQFVQNSQVSPPPAAGISKPITNFNTDDVGTYKNNINYLNNLFRLQQQREQPYQLNENNNHYLQNARRSSIYNFKNVMPRSSRSSSTTVKSWYTNDTAFTDSDYEAHLLDFLLLGDDFLLYMARMELKCKFKKNQRILQSGLCVSGQTIGASLKRIRALRDDTRRSIIVNIGSVDIMQGRQLIQIEHDFRELLVTMLKKGIRPILTTLAPLANYSHNNDMKSMVERFNDFIKREGQRRNLIVIDICKCLVNDKGQVLFDCYQNEPRNVTGTSESYLFWNKIGRQRVLQLIESHLEY